MFQPLVSVIIPCYNGSAYLADCIESVIAQTFGDWEMLIVDDCSTDDSARIIKEYALRDSRIKYFRTEKPSGSPSIPRNIGIEQSHGNYIAFLDCDDIWLPNKLELQINFIREHSYPLIYSFYEKMNWKGIRNNRIVRTRDTTTYNNLLKSNSIPILTSLVDRKIIGTTRFKRISQEDYYFWLVLLKKGYTAYSLKKITALYRESKNSRSANKIAMFRGYWNVIRHQLHTPILFAYYYTITYFISGLVKYFK